jgi:hypothetical protein
MNSVTLVSWSLPRSPLSCCLNLLLLEFGFPHFLASAQFRDKARYKPELRMPALCLRGGALP